MNIYGGKQLAESFRGVRREHDHDRGGNSRGSSTASGRCADVKSVAEQLAHIAVVTGWQIELHTGGSAHVDFAMFGASLARGASEEQALTSKAAIVAALQERRRAVRVAFSKGSATSSSWQR